MTATRARRRRYVATVPKIDEVVAADWEADLTSAEIAVSVLLSRVIETRRQDYWLEHYLWSVHRTRLLELRRKIHAVTL